MKKKLIKLEIPPEKSLFYAISCHNPLHKIAWQINKELSLQLKDSEGIHKDDLIFPAHLDEVSFPDFTILIVQNKLEASILIKDLTNIDYIIKFQGNISANTAKEIVGKLKRTSSIIAVIAIDIKNIKGINILQNL
ncbi:MAG: hypothetical protein CVT98_05845 [Bacteroidetes bacterium HGW-Bacteroidetes-15]|nr:MAG: hypothetical protein CVT98_05845 [Bacteroidetes bacterium HGW-Bacteroidetes-15]